jgi:hypothetical protein
LIKDGGKMAAQEEISKDVWFALSGYTRRRVTMLTIGANLIGALIVTGYFTFFDQALKYEQI